MANFIKFDPPDIADFANNLEQCKTELSGNVDTALKAGATEITNEQRRIIAQKSTKLSSYIHIKPGITSKGKRYYEVGYTGQEPVEKWLYGVVLEFGRPGKRNKAYVTQKRKTKDGITEIKVRNGWIEEYSHIRRGFDNKVESAADNVKSAFDNTISKLGG